MKQKHPVLLVKLGQAPDELRGEHGGYPDWFSRAWGDTLQVLDARPHKAPTSWPKPRNYAGIIVSGSSLSLATPAPWMDDAAELLRCANDVGTPVFGVCFGHQLIGHAFGGRVVRNPKGWEVGTCDVAVNDEGAADPLFVGLPRALRVNLTHEDMVEPQSLPAPGSLRVLAGNPKTAVQVLALGEHIRGVQFHPEISGAIARAYIQARRARLLDQDPDALIARTQDAPHGQQVMRNFRRYFVEKA
jgi:GMP synthase (glutamine-hydrolysing)